jgi:hypothetical protein
VNGGARLQVNGGARLQVNGGARLELYSQIFISGK